MGMDNSLHPLAGLDGFEGIVDLAHGESVSDEGLDAYEAFVEKLNCEAVLSRHAAV